MSDRAAAGPEVAMELERDDSSMQLSGSPGLAMLALRSMRYNGTRAGHGSWKSGAARFVGATLLIVAALLLMSTVAEAKRVALVVGNSEYDKVARLLNPQRDAGVIADRLRLIGFEVSEAFNTNLPALKRATDRFVLEAATAELAVFYFAGHGVQIFDRNYLLSKEVDANRVTSADGLGLDLYQFAERMQTSGATRILFIVDACRDNPFGFEETIALLQRIRSQRSNQTSSELPAAAARQAMRGLAGMALAPNEVKRRQVGSGAATQSAGGEMMLFFAAQPGAVSHDGATATAANSPLVEGFIEELARPERPVSDILRGVSTYVRRVTSGAQVPQIVSDWSLDSALAPQARNPVRYSINSKRTLTADEEKLVVAAAAGYSSFDGDFLVKASLGSGLSMSEDERRKADDLGVVGGIELLADLDGDGRDETTVIAWGSWNDPPLRLLIRFDDVIVRVPLCYGSGGDRMEVGLRDLNGDRRPEIWVTNGRSYCIYEFRGIKELAEWRRAHNDPEPKLAPSDAFRLLLSTDGTSGLFVSKDNTIKVCTGSGCHSPEYYKFANGFFTEVPAGASALPPLDALPFSDMAHRNRLRYDHHLRRSAPLKVGAWRTAPAAEQGMAAITLDLGGDRSLSYRCNKIGPTEELLVRSTKSRPLPIGYATEDRGALAATPLTVGSTTCAIRGLDWDGKGTRSIELASSTSVQCVRALAAGGTLTLPLRWLGEEEGLIQVALPRSEALASARAACLGVASPAVASPLPPPNQNSPPTISDLDTRILRFVVEKYLADEAGVTEQSLSAMYAKTVNYNGKIISREEHVKSTLRYLQSWTKREYRVVPASLVLKAGPANNRMHDIQFDFTFYAQRKGGTARCGDGTVELTVVEADGSFIISRVRDRATGRDC